MGQASVSRRIRLSSPILAQARREAVEKAYIPPRLRGRLATIVDEEDEVHLVRTNSLERRQV